MKRDRRRLRHPACKSRRIDSSDDEDEDALTVSDAAASLASPCPSSSSPTSSSSPPPDLDRADELVEHKQRKPGSLQRRINRFGLAAIAASPARGHPLEAPIEGAMSHLLTAHDRSPLAGAAQLIVISAELPPERPRFEIGRRAHEGDRCAVCNLKRNCSLVRLPALNPDSGAWFSIGSTCLKRLALAARFATLSADVTRWLCRADGDNEEEEEEDDDDDDRFTATCFVARLRHCQADMAQACGMGDDKPLRYNARSGRYEGGGKRRGGHNDEDHSHHYYHHSGSNDEEDD
jgi:hypothetical protein